MITRIEALRYKCFHYISQALNEFQILVGPNASGKTTFLDILSFLSDLVNYGPEKAIEERTSTMDFRDLLWNGQGDNFELAVEASVPENISKVYKGQQYKIIRYEVRIGYTSNNYIGILEEKAILLVKSLREYKRDLPWFPSFSPAPQTIFYPKRIKNSRSVIAKIPQGNDNFYSEVYKKKGKGWAPSIKLGPKRSALANLPAEEENFPATSWLRKLLAEGVQKFVLNSIAMRKPSPFSKGITFKTDGSNLPWVIKKLKEKNPKNFQEWLKHIRTALPDIEDIRIIVREEDRHGYIKVRYANNIEIPSWNLSDGTLRFLALTLPAYLPELSGIYLIEEPENGVHPYIMQSIYDSLRSVYDAQIFIATHSPVLLGLAEPKDILCFSRTSDGTIDIVRGNEHPRLKNWRREVSLGTLLAGGILG